MALKFKTYLQCDRIIIVTAIGNDENRIRVICSRDQKGHGEEKIVGISTETQVSRRVINNGDTHAEIIMIFT